MRLLDRYLLRELLIPFSYCLCGFLLFWITFDLFKELDSFQRHGLNTLDVAWYYVVKLPEFMVFPMVPAAWLLALLYAITHHARHNELTAIRAAGVSLWRLAMPYLVMGFLLSATLLVLNEWWVPQGNLRAEAILNSRQKTEEKADTPEWETKVGFSNLRENRTWYIEAYNRATGQMLRPHVEWTLATGTRCTIDAAEGVWSNGVWVFKNVQELVFPAVRDAIPLADQKEERVMSEFTETPEEIESQLKINQIGSLKDIRRTELSIREILQYRRLHPADSPKAAMLSTKLHGRLAAPWTCLVIVLIALPFGMGSGRRNVFVGVASSIVICFAYFVLLQLGLAFGSGGFVPPWVAAWTPNVLFGLGGCTLSWRVR